MGILSSGISIARYRVQGQVEDPFIEKVTEGLKRNMIQEIDQDPTDMSIGWTSYDKPFAPNFEGSNFIIGPYLVFSMRIDKKSVPSKVVQKHVAIEVAKRLEETDRDFLSRNEIRQIKEHVTDVLTLRVPSVPNVYDLIWNYEEQTVWFYSTQKAANEELETLFAKSFNVLLVRMFPYTIADLSMGLSDAEKDIMAKLTPTKFTE